MSASNHSRNFKGRRYVPDRPVKVLDRHGPGGEMYWKVEVDGNVYFIARTRGSKAIHIMYKPRGENIGWHWYGAVRDAKGKDVWTGQVNKSTGPLAMLRYAAIISWQWEVDAIEQKEQCLRAEADAEWNARNLP